MSYIKRNPMYYNGSSGSQKSIEYPAGSIVAHCVSLVKDPPGWIICDGNPRTVDSNSNRYDQLLSLGIGNKNGVHAYDGEVNEIDIYGNYYYPTGQVFDYTPPDLSNMLLKGYGGTTTDASGNLVKDTNSSNTVTITSDNIPSHSHNASYSDSHTHTSSSLTDTHNHSDSEISISINNHTHSFNTGSQLPSVYNHSHSFDFVMPEHQHQLYTYVNDLNWKGGSAPTLRDYGDADNTNSTNRWSTCTYMTTTVNQTGVDAGHPDYTNPSQAGTNLGSQCTWGDGTTAVYIRGPEDNTGTLNGGGTYPPTGYGWWENVSGDTETGAAGVTSQTIDSGDVTFTLLSSDDKSENITNVSSNGEGGGTETTIATYNGDISSGTETTTTGTTIDILPSSFKVYWLMKL